MKLAWEILFSDPKLFILFAFTQVKLKVWYNCLFGSMRNTGLSHTVVKQALIDALVHISIKVLALTIHHHLPFDSWHISNLLIHHQRFYFMALSCAYVFQGEALVEMLLLLVVLSVVWALYSLAWSFSVLTVFVRILSGLDLFLEIENCNSFMLIVLVLTNINLQIWLQKLFVLILFNNIKVKIEFSFKLYLSGFYLFVHLFLDWLILFLLRILLQLLKVETLFVNLILLFLIDFAIDFSELLAETSSRPIEIIVLIHLDIVPVIIIFFISSLVWMEVCFEITRYGLAKHLFVM